MINDCISDSENVKPKKISRHQTRFVCIQILIQAILTNFSNTFEHYIQQSQIVIDEVFCKQLYDCVYKHGQFFTEILTKHIKTKSFDTLDIALKAILFCALAELFFMQQGKKIVISEYILLTKRFAGVNDHKMIHAVLDSINK